MAALAPNTVKSTTIENGLLEIAQRLQVAEQAFSAPEGQTQPNRVNVTVNSDTRLATITATLPLDIGVDGTTGQLTIEAAEYC